MQRDKIKQGRVMMIFTGCVEQKGAEKDNGRVDE